VCRPGRRRERNERRLNNLEKVSSLIHSLRTIRGCKVTSPPKIEPPDSIHIIHTQHSIHTSGSLFLLRPECNRNMGNALRIRLPVTKRTTLMHCCGFFFKRAHTNCYPLDTICHTIEATGRWYTTPPRTNRLSATRYVLKFWIGS
jgi:hypothetical protein